MIPSYTLQLSKNTAFSYIQAKSSYKKRALSPQATYSKRIKLDDKISNHNFTSSSTASNSPLLEKQSVSVLSANNPSEKTSSSSSTNSAIDEKALVKHLCQKLIDKNIIINGDTLHILALAGYGSSCATFKAHRKRDNCFLALKLPIHPSFTPLLLKEHYFSLKLINNPLFPLPIYPPGRLLISEQNSEQRLAFTYEWVEHNFYKAARNAVLQKKEGFCLAKIAQLTKILLIAIKTLHNAQIIHGDLKMDNFGFKENGHLRIFDLGLSNWEDDEPTEIVTTTCNRAPEVTGTHIYNCKIDIWSISCIAFELFSRSTLFTNNDQTHQEECNICLDAHIRDPRSLTQRIRQANLHRQIQEKPKIVRLFESFLRQGLCLKPEDRPGAQELLSHRFIQYYSS